MTRPRSSKLGGFLIAAALLAPLPARATTPCEDNAVASYKRCMLRSTADGYAACQASLEQQVNSCRQNPQADNPPPAGNHGTGLRERLRKALGEQQQQDEDTPQPAALPAPDGQDAPDQSTVTDPTNNDPLSGYNYGLLTPGFDLHERFYPDGTRCLSNDCDWAALHRYRQEMGLPDDEVYGPPSPPQMPQGDPSQQQSTVTGPTDSPSLPDPGPTITITIPPVVISPNVGVGIPNVQTPNVGVGSPNVRTPNVAVGTPNVQTPNVAVGTPNVQTPSTITQQPDVGMASPQTPSTVTGTPNAPGPGGILIDVAPKGQTSNLSDLRSKVLNLQQNGNNAHVGQ